MAVYHDRNLIINYIPRDMTDVELLGLFSRYGSVKTCRIIRDRNTGISFGFGFCEYDTSDCARNAISRLNGFRINDKVLKVSFARIQETSNTTNLYIKNFPIWVTEHHLCALLSRYGRIVQCRVLRDHATQQPKGAAYVLFECQADAELAKENVDGRPWPGSSDCLPVSIRFASPPHRLACKKTTNHQNHRSSQQNAIPCTDQTLISGSNISSQLLAACNQRTIQNGCQQDQKRYNSQGILGQNSNFVHSGAPSLYGVIWPSNNPVVTDVPAVSNQFSFAQPGYFQHPSLTQQPLSILWPQSFTPSGLQTSQFSNACIPAHNSMLNGTHFNGPLPNLLAPYFTHDVARPQNLLNFGLNLTPSIAFDKRNESDRIKSKTDKGTNNINSLYVYNIGNFTSELQLFYLFVRFGNIVNVSIPKDLETGLNKNFGFVSFSNLQSATNAIDSMNGHRFQNRQLQVSFKRFNNNSSTLKNGLHNSNFIFNGTKTKLTNDCSNNYVNSKENSDQAHDLPKDMPFISENKETLTCDNSINLPNGIQ